MQIISSLAAVAEDSCLVRYGIALRSAVYCGLLETAFGSVHEEDRSIWISAAFGVVASFFRDRAKEKCRGDRGLRPYPNGVGAQEGRGHARDIHNNLYGNIWHLLQGIWVNMHHYENAGDRRINSTGDYRDSRFRWGQVDHA
jgi:hypothetical protein